MAIFRSPSRRGPLRCRRSASAELPRPEDKSSRQYDRPPTRVTVPVRPLSSGDRYSRSSQDRYTAHGQPTDRRIASIQQLGPALPVVVRSGTRDVAGAEQAPDELRQRVRQVDDRAPDSGCGSHGDRETLAKVAGTSAFVSAGPACVSRPRQLVAVSADTCRFRTCSGANGPYVRATVAVPRMHAHAARG